MFAPSEPTELELGAIPDLVAEDLEFIEFYNPSEVVLSLLDLELGGDVELTFANETMLPGEYVVAVSNLAAFQARYGTEIRVVGEWENTLANHGAHVVLNDTDNHPIVDVVLASNDEWHEPTYGIGASLEVTDPFSRSDLSRPSAWNSSRHQYGSPGQRNSPLVDVVINEVISNSVLRNSIELFNTTDAPIELSGAWLSDSSSHLEKYQFPNDTMIEANGFLMIYDSDFNPDPENPSETSFDLRDRDGGELWLTRGADDGPTEFVDHVRWRAQKLNLPWGRSEESQFEFVPLSHASINTENAGVTLGPVVVSEVQYQSDIPSFEAIQIAPEIRPHHLSFVELYNSSESSVDISEWRLERAVELEFAETTELSSHELIVLVTFDPDVEENLALTDAFRTHYQIGPEIRLTGAFVSNYTETFGRIDLLEAGPVDKIDTSFRPLHLHDRVRFDSSTPWPVDTNGGGDSLHRTAIDAFGGIAQSWTGAAPSPGSSPLVPPPPFPVAVSEIMVAPVSPSELELTAIPDAEADAFEFIELFNPNQHRSLDLHGIELSGDIELTLWDVELGAEEYGVLVADPVAFEMRYGTEARILGTWNGNLSDQSTSFAIEDADGQMLSEVRIEWDSHWPSRSQLGGASLERINTLAANGELPTRPNDWSGSSSRLGTPGRPRQLSQPIRINEVLAGSEVVDGVSDSIEIVNIGDEAIDISGWFLSNSISEPRKYVVPNETVIEAGQYFVFDESDFNANPQDPTDTGFSLDANLGDQVWLFASNDEGVAAFVDEFVFSTQADGASIGRIPDGSGEWIVQSELSLGRENEHAQVGRILISEINFDPAPPLVEASELDPTITTAELEFIELFNSADRSINISNWGIEGSTSITFPPETQLEAFGTLVVVPFESTENPQKADAFRTQYGLPDSASILGGFDSFLSDDFGSLRLLEALEESELHVEHDLVRYESVNGWPQRNEDESLHRNSRNSAGTLASSWASNDPSPGATALVPPPPKDAVMTEVMYFPPPPTPEEIAVAPQLTASSFEYIELFNPNTESSISLLDYQVLGDIELTFDDVSLAPGEYGVIVNDPTAFETRYPAEINVVGHWQGELGDEGLHAQLLNHAGDVVQVLDLVTDRRWPALSDGVGASLELRDVSSENLNSYEAWQASYHRLGTPGAKNSSFAGVAINEVLSAAAAAVDEGDAIELFNTTETPIDLGGWRLASGLDLEHYYQFPPETNLASGEYLVIDRSALIPDPESPAPNALSLDGIRGGQLWLLEMVDNSIASFGDHVQYGPQKTLQSWARVPNGSGDLVPTTGASIGSSNNAVAVGPFLVSELSHQPNPPTEAALQIDSLITASDLRFVELFNSANHAIDVSGWRVSGDVDFHFADGTSIPSQETVVLLGFDPGSEDMSSRADAFRAHYAIDQSVNLIGPATFDLQAQFGEITIQELAEPPESDPELDLLFLHDEIHYDDGLGWSVPALGQTFHRMDDDSSGRQPSSWEISGPTPGVSQLKQPSPMLLPDLTLWNDPLLGFNHLELVDTHAATGNKLIRFATATANVGSGPLIIEGRDVSVNGDQQVYQIIHHADGTTSDRLAGDFIYHPTHNHVHFDDYALYNLRAIDESGEPGGIVASGDKVSFCLADFSPFDFSLENAPDTWVFTACESSTQGISVGWADVYGSDLDDQWIDVEGVPAGEYWLETVIDPSNRLLESDETNNTYLSKVVIGVPEYEPDFLDMDRINDLALGTGDKFVNDLSIHRPGDIDTFRWIAPNDGELTVDVTFDREMGDVDLYIWGGTGSRVVLASSTSDTSSLESATTQVVKGIQYFVVVKDLSGHTQPDYQLSIDGPDILPDEYEENNSFLAASILAAGNQRIENLTIHEADDEDYFAWTADETTQVLVSVDFANNEGDVDLYVYDFGTHAIHSSTTNRNADSLIFDAAQGETYLIAVVPKRNELNSNYGLSVDVLEVPRDRLEPNDSDRTPVDIGSGDQFIQDLTIHAPFNRDFYRWQPLAAGFAEFHLSFTHSDGNLDLVIWVNGESTEFAITNDDDEHISLEVSPENEYLIEVAGRGDSINPSYDLAISTPQAARIAAVRVGDSQSLNEPFDLLDEINEIRTVPWPNIDQIEIRFTEDVIVDRDGFQLMMDESVLPILDFEYVAATQIATWTFAEPLSDGLFSAILRDSVHDPFGNPLDGEWPGGSATLPSGDGIPGGDFSFFFRVLTGDVDGNGFVNVDDIDSFAAALITQDRNFDLDGSGTIDRDDVQVLLSAAFNSGVGDANLDGRFDSTDLILIFQAGEYEDALVGNSTWASGDWNLDGEFDTTDLVAAFTFGDYVTGASAPNEANEVFHPIVLDSHYHQWKRRT